VSRNLPIFVPEASYSLSSELLSDIATLKSHQIYINDDSLYLYTICPDATAPLAQLDFLVASLSETDRTRYRSFKNYAAAVSFVLGRILIRRGISSALDIDPKTVSIDALLHEKPKFSGCEFSISRSNGFLVGIFGRRTEVGIDIEFPLNILEVDEIVSKYFPVSYQQLYNAHTSINRYKIFWNLWTDLESQLKLSGQGIFSVKSMRPSGNTIPLVFESLPIVGSLSYIVPTKNDY